MKAMIFAAGLGTRLKPLTDTLPKALVPVCGRPLIEHVCRKLARAGISEAVVNVHHFAGQVEDWLAGQDWINTSQADSRPGDMLVQISDERSRLLETGGAVLHARRFLEGCGSFLLHYVDILSNLDIEWFASQVRPGVMATLLVSPRKSSRQLLFDPRTMRLVGWHNLQTGQVRSPTTGNQSSIEEQLEQYIIDHIEKEPDALRQLNRDTHIYQLYSRMCSGHLQGRILKMLTTMIRPRRILELGTFTGYSALCFAEGMPQDAELHTIEIFDEMEDFIKERFEASPYADRIHLHIGDALDIIPTIEGDFDMVFIDANKRNYIEYFEMVLPRLTPGGFILADNTLWDGKVADPAANNDAQTRGILDFNDLVAHDSRVSCVILPLRDGLTLIRKNN